MIDPATVCGWFRPPAQGGIDPNGEREDTLHIQRALADLMECYVDLELYTTRVDAYGLLALAAVLLVISDAVPLPSSMAGSALTDPTVDVKAKKPYAKAIIVITMLHHAATGVGAYGHWALPTHRTVAMDIGVWGNVGLVLLGAAALVHGFGQPEVVEGRKKTA